MLLIVLCRVWMDHVFVSEFSMLPAFAVSVANIPVFAGPLDRYDSMLHIVES